LEHGKGWLAATTGTPQGMVARRKVRVWGMARIPALIPTGLNQSAWGCEERATPGNPIKHSSTLKGLHHAPDDDSTPSGLDNLRDDSPV
jgi:hypothetical protein